MEAEGPVPKSGLRRVADVGNSTWPKYKPLDGRRENGTFALLNLNLEAFSPLVHGVPKSNTIKKK